MSPSLQAQSMKPFLMRVSLLAGVPSIAAIKCRRRRFHLEATPPETIEKQRLKKFSPKCDFLLVKLFLFCSYAPHEQHPLPRPIPDHPTTPGACAFSDAPRRLRYRAQRHARFHAFAGPRLGRGGSGALAERGLTPYACAASLARSRKMATARRSPSAIFSGGMAPENSKCRSSTKDGTPEIPAWR